MIKMPITPKPRNPTLAERLASPNQKVMDSEAIVGVNQKMANPVAPMAKATDHPAESMAKIIMPGINKKKKLKGAITKSRSRTFKS